MSPTRGRCGEGMSNEEEETEKPKTVLCPDCEGKGQVPVETAGGFNVIGWTECSECWGGEIEIETEDLEWYRKKCNQRGLPPEA